MNQEKRKLLLLATAYRHIKRKNRKQNKHGRRWWVHPINARRTREGAWALLIEEFRSTYPDKHRDCFRVDPQSFDFILDKVKHLIVKEDTQMRKAISSEQRLAITLMYLSTGDSIKTLSVFYRIGESTIRSIIYETSLAIWESMKGEY